jgi:hypothetical protein
MKQYLALLFFFAATTVFAQTKKFSVGVSGTPLWSGYLKTNKSVIRDNPKGGFGFQAGLFGEYAFSTTFSLRVGAGYLEVPNDIPKMKVVFPQPEPNQPDFMAIQSDDQFLSIPILLKFHFRAAKKWYGITGTNFWIPVGTKQKITSWFSDGSVTTKSNRYEPAGIPNLLSGSLGLGYEFNLTPKLHFFLEPMATIVWASLSGGGLGLRPYTAGLNTGIRF